MINTLKQISHQLCKPVLAGLKESPKTHVFAHAYGKPSLITAMYHVMGFNGNKLERVTNVNEAALKKYSIFLIRPFYHSLHVTLYVNRGNEWQKLGQITRHKVEFERSFQQLAFKLIPNHNGWTTLAHQSGIVKLKPPVVDTLPTMASIISRFGELPSMGQLGNFVLNTLDGMTRSGDLPTYIRAAMSVLHFNVTATEAGIVLESDIPGASVRFEFDLHDGKPPVSEQLSQNAKISEKLKKIRETTEDEYGSFFDIVMLRALKNTLVIIPYEGYKAHSIEMIQEENVNGNTHIDAYMISKDPKSKPQYIRVYGSITVK